MHLQYHCQVYGITQSGKTYLALRLLNEQNENSIRIFIDTKGENRPPNMKYYKYFSSFKQLKEDGTYRNRKIFKFDEIKDVYSNYEIFKGKLLLFQPSFDEPYKKQMEKFSKFLLNYHRRNPFAKTYLLIDELQEYCSSHTVAQYLRSLFVMGLSLGITCIFTSQRYSLVNSSIRNNSEVFITLKQVQQDLDAMYERGYIEEPNLEFRRKYQAYMRTSLNDTLKVIQ